MSVRAVLAFSVALGAPFLLEGVDTGEYGSNNSPWRVVVPRVCVGIALTFGWLYVCTRYLPAP